jgi:hypothetical protein
MIGLALAVLAAGSVQTPDLTWLQGQWCTRVEQGRQTCEQWAPMRGGMMLGTSQTVRDGETREFEFMRIATALANGDGPVIRLALIASPNGMKPTVFAWSPDARPGVTFFNVANDYPQRIRYWRVGARLHAEIALADGSKPMRWVYSRVR